MKLLMMFLLVLQATAPLKPTIPADRSQVQPKGSYGIRNQQFGLFLRPRDASSRDGEPIVLYPQQPWKCMAWHFDNVPGGTRLTNFFTSKSFEVELSSTVKAVVQKPLASDHDKAQSFSFVALQNGFYEIVSASGDALTGVDSDGHGDIRVIAAPWKNLASQRWELVDIPSHFTM